MSLQQMVYLCVYACNRNGGKMQAAREGGSGDVGTMAGACMPHVL